MPLHHRGASTGSPTVLHTTKLVGGCPRRVSYASPRVLCKYVMSHYPPGGQDEELRQKVDAARGGVHPRRAQEVRNLQQGAVYDSAARYKRPMTAGARAAVVSGAQALLADGVAVEAGEHGAAVAAGVRLEACWTIGAEADGRVAPRHGG